MYSNIMVDFRFSRAIDNQNLFYKQWSMMALNNSLGLCVGPELQSFRQMGGSAVFAFPEFAYYQKHI